MSPIPRARSRTTFPSTWTAPLLTRTRASRAVRARWLQVAENEEERDRLVLSMRAGRRALDHLVPFRGTVQLRGAARRFNGASRRFLLLGVLRAAGSGARPASGAAVGGRRSSVGGLRDSSRGTLQDRPAPRVGEVELREDQVDWGGSGSGFSFASPVLRVTLSSVTV